MTDFTLAGGSYEAEWSANVTKEYIRESAFGPYFGQKSIINAVDDLKSNAGNLVHVNVIGKLRGPGLTGSQTMVGNEDVMSSRSMGVYTDIIKNAVVVNMEEQFKTSMGLGGLAKDRLQGWLAEKLRSDLIVALRSVPVAGAGTGPHPEDLYKTFANAQAADLNNFQTANADRLLFGKNNSNLTAGNFATSLGKVTSADTVSAVTINKLKKKVRMTSQSTTFAINPYKTKSGQEWFVMFVDSNGYRDAWNDPVIYAANKDARPRERDIEENPIFNGSDVLMYNGVIIQHVPELTPIATGVGVAHMCGIQAVNVAYSRSVRYTKRNEDDYQSKIGVGVDEIRGQSLATVDQTLVGMANFYHASVDDA